MRRRPASRASNGSSEEHDTKLKQSSSHHDDDVKNVQGIVPNWIVAAVVVFFVGLGFVQRHYQDSRGKGPLTGQKNPVVVVDDKSSSSSSISKRSLLTQEQDAALEVDPKTGLRYHLVFSTDCSPYQHWQSYVVYYTAMKVQQTGYVTRIASGCDDDQAAAMQKWFDDEVQFMSKRFHLQLTPQFSDVKNDKGEKVGNYKFFNKPFGLKYWMEHSPQLNWDEPTDAFPSAVQGDVVILIDPDMALLRPITADFSDDRETIISPNRREHLVARQVAPGKPFAQVYGFGAQWARLDLKKIAGEGTPAAAVSRQDGLWYYPAGPPYLATVQDMHRIAVKWTEFVPGVYEQYPHLLAEMFAYCIAAAHLELPHQLIDSLMISNIGANGEGWGLVNKIPANEMCAFAKNHDHSKYAVPTVVHLCQRYSVGKEWFFGKRRIPSDIYDCETPLFVEPPDDLAVKYDYKWPPGGTKTQMSEQAVAQHSFVICFLYSMLNEAATFYKQNTCPADKINLSKTRSLVNYVADQKRHK